MATTWRPASFVRQSQLRISWRQVVALCGPSGAPGIRYSVGRQTGAHVLQYRDEAGQVIGVFVLDSRGVAFARTHPKRQRHGVYTALLLQAFRLGIAIDFKSQEYTAAGWRATARALETSGRSIDECSASAARAPLAPALAMAGAAIRSALEGDTRQPRRTPAADRA